MNNGKICISVCAETADELIEQIKRAENLADVIEIRFDCLSKNEFDFTLNEILRLKPSKPFLATFRPKEKEAEIVLSLMLFENEVHKQKVFESQNYRFSGWKKILTIENVSFLDFEQDILLDLFISESFINSQKETQNFFSEEIYNDIKKKIIIASEHFFEKVPVDLNETYDELKSDEPEVLGNKIIKIAAQADNISDTIPIWKLLERAKSENKEIIPIAMGESGKWTRILGLAHGAFLTYAALDSGKETAPGQVSAKDLVEIYRAKELDEKTEVYGIIAGNTSYTLSPYIHNAAFKFHKLNSVFVPLQVQNLDEFMRRMVLENSREIELNFKGFAVTNPHKKTIIKYLDEIDETAEKIGAVNTVKIENGKFYGYNTDANGFIEPLKNAYGDLSGAKVAVFGAGGAARACIYAFKKENAAVTIFARNLEKSESLAQEFEVQSSKFKAENENYNEFDIAVNTTPLGTKGKFENQTIVSAEQIESIKLLYDLVYSPFQTHLMSEADKVHVPKIGGLAMLIAQAMGQQKIWTGKAAPMKEMSRAALERLK